MLAMGDDSFYHRACVANTVVDCMKDIGDDEVSNSRFADGQNDSRIDVARHKMLKHEFK